jgi:vacuolar-type H+-ATPase subunit C/Vma6
MAAFSRLPGMGERAYAYAKACGIIGKSFVGKRIRGLEKASRLSELDRMVFPADPRSLPEKELLRDLEKRIIARAVNSIISIAECFSKLPEFFILLIRGYEYADLYSAIISSGEKEKAAPAHTDLGHFQTVRFEAWPDVQKMIEGTTFDFLLDKNGVFDQERNSISLQSVLDRHYYNTLWKSLFSLPAGDRQAAEKILSDEISLKNSCWALRLRTYYGMNTDEVKLHLVDVPPGRKKSLRQSSRTLADAAQRCLEFPLDNYPAWASWRWKGFLNSPSDSRQWQADPRYFQNAASRYLVHLAARYFHSNPSSLDSIFCFIKLKQFEEDVLTSCAEGLGIGMSARDIVSMLGIEQ